MELAIGLALGLALATATLCAAAGGLAILEQRSARDALGRGALDQGERSLARSLALTRTAALGRRTASWARRAIELALVRKVLGRGEAARHLAEEAAVVAETRRAAR